MAKIILVMDSGLPLDKVQTVLRRVPMELHGPVGVQAFSLLRDMVSLMVKMVLETGYGLLLVKVQTLLRRAPMGLLGPVALLVPLMGQEYHMATVYGLPPV